MTQAADLGDAYEANSRLLQINQMLAALQAGTASISGVMLSIGGGPAILVPISPNSGDAIYTRITNLLNARKTALENLLTNTYGVTL